MDVKSCVWGWEGVARDEGEVRLLRQRIKFDPNVTFSAWQVGHNHSLMDDQKPEEIPGSTACAGHEHLVSG